MSWNDSDGGDSRDLVAVQFAKGPYADLVSHARSALDREVCGVLVGTAHKTDEGHRLDIKAIIQGSSVRQGATHVTFTNETWTEIHQTLERDHPGLQIVGWYHSHPGFGVEFSEMDEFIHENFFPLPSQVGLVTDPLSGEVAVYVNSPSGVVPLSQIEVDQKPLRCTRSTRNSGSAVSYDRSLQDLQDLEKRMRLHIQKFEDRQGRFQSFVTYVVVAVLALVVAWIGFSMYRYYTAKPAKLDVRPVSNIGVPVTIGDKTVVLYVQVVGVEMLQDETEGQDAPKTDETGGSDNSERGQIDE